ncbi:chromosome partition protein MukB [Vibrio harveyi]|uniref:chromosome partition protein MukB n=1 Tax=Vibrio harveyi TaxID=669 RepID=UPI00066B0166|nr:chromosome partition protein MukB [Vibrio harveyi]
MNKTLPILHSLSLVNLNGITARTLDLVELKELLAQQLLSPFGNTVSLLGENGAGKTSILGAYQLSLVADMRFVSLGTSDKFKKAQKLIDSEMFHRLGNPSTVALEVQTRNNSRHLYVIHATKPNGTNITMTRMRLVLPKGIKPMACLAMQENNSWIPFTPNMIRDTAVSLGCELTTYDSADGYLLDLFNDGVLPKPLQKERDKANFAQIFHSAMSGRLDESIERNLSSYLMSHTRGSIKGVVDILQDSMRVVRQTRVELSQNAKDYGFFKQLLDYASDASSYAWAVAEKQLLDSANRLHAAQAERIAANQALTKAQAAVATLEAELEQLRQERDKLEEKRNKTEDQLLLATKAAGEHSRRERFKQEHEELMPEVEEAKQAYEQTLEHYQLVSEQSSQVQKELAETQEQLADAVKAFETSSERAGKYEFACRQLKTVEEFFGKVDPENLTGPMADLGEEKTICGSELNILERQLQQMNEIRVTYHDFSKKLGLIGEKIAPESLQNWVTDKRQHMNQLQVLVGNLPYEQEKLTALNSDLETQHKYKNVLFSAELGTVPDSVQAFVQTVALYRQKVIDASDAALTAKTKLDKLAGQEQQLKIELVQVENRHHSWAQLQPHVQGLLEAYPEQNDWSGNSCHSLQRELSSQRDVLREQVAEYSATIVKDSKELDNLRNRDSGHLELLRTLAEEIDGLPVCDLFDDIDPVDARYMEAALGSLMNGILVDDPQTASRHLLATYGDDWPLEDLLLVPGGKPIEEWRSGDVEQDMLFKDITANFVGSDGSAEAPWCILVSGEGLRISQLRDNPVLGDKAREALISRLEAEIEEYEAARSKAEDAIAVLSNHIDALRFVLQQVGLAFSAEPDLETAKANVQKMHRILTDAKSEYTVRCEERKQVTRSLDKLEQCEPFVQVMYRDIAAEITTCEAIIVRCIDAQRETERFAPLFKNFDTEWVLLMQPYPVASNELEQRVKDQNARYHELSNQLRNMEGLHEVRFHLGSTYAQAKALLGDTNHKQQVLKDQAKQLSNHVETLNGQKQNAENDRDKAQQHSMQLNAKIQQLESELGRSELELKQISIDYHPGMEKQLDAERKQLDNACKSAQEKADKHSGDLSQARELQQQMRSAAEACMTKETFAQTMQENLTAARQAVMDMVANDGVGTVLQGAMSNALEAIEDTDTAFQKVQSLISRVNGCAQDYGIPVTDPMLAFGQQLTGTNFAEVVHLYAEAVKLFKRRARHDIIHSGDPQQMLIELDEACRMAQKSLDNAESMFQTKRGELGEAIAKRVVDEQRAVRKLSNQLHGIGFGQVAEVRLVTDYVPKFDKVLDALRQGSQVMDDLFAEAESVEKALSDLYHRTTAGEIKGEKLLDHRNYLMVKTQIRRRGRSEFEDLEGTHLSTGERLGSGLVVLISIIKHWAGAAHGKKAFAVPLVMDEVSRLDAHSQATVAELCRRCGVQLLMAAPESLGKITGLGYQLVRVWPEGVNIDNPSKADEARSWVQITGLQDGTELTVNGDSVLNSIVGS